jgi:Na+-driven multidrug efflux pump
MGIVNIVNLIASFLMSGIDVAVADRTATGEIVRRVIFENPSPLDWGVVGIALGTAFAWSVGGVVMLAMLGKGVHGVRLRARRLRLHWHTIRRLINIGLPNMSETLAMWLGNFLIIMMIGWLRDPGVIGANVIAIRIEAFSFMPGFAMSLAAGTLAGTYLGAGSARMAILAVWRCQAIAAIVMGLTGLAFMLFPLAITGLFSQQPAHLELAPKALRITGAVQAVFSLCIVLRGALRGAGATGIVMWITWISIWAVRLPIAWLGCGVDIPLPGGLSIPNPAPLQPLGIHPLVGLWLGLCTEIVIRAALFVYVFLKGDWTRSRV